MTKMEQTSSESTSVFDLLRARMGMPPIESVLPLPQESNNWSQQIVDALRRHWMSVLRTTSWWRARSYTVRTTRVASSGATSRLNLDQMKWRSRTHTIQVS